MVETGRLRLRGHRLDDFAHTAAMWSDARVAQFTTGKPLTREESWTRLLRYTGHWSLLGFGYWLVEEKSTGEFVGEVGFGEFKRDLEPALDGLPELGWVLTPAQHGKGYATEAATAALDWARVHLSPTHGFSCLIHPDHSASLRVAAKCGFAEVWRSTYRGRPAIVFEAA